MDIGATQWTEKPSGDRDKTSITYYNCGKKSHVKRNYRSKKEWRPVLGKETATIEEVKKVARVKEIAAASYIQEDLEDAMDWDNDLEATLVESETSSKDYDTLIRGLSAELTDLAREESILEELSNGRISIDDEEVAPLRYITRIVVNWGIGLV